jgi:integrase
MSTLRQSVDTYLALRRGLGAELRDPGFHLRRFVEFLEAEGATVITTDLALRWAQSTGAMPATCASRLADVRRFATWHSATEPRTEVPPEGLLPHRYRRRPPYIYTDEEIRRLVTEAAHLPSTSGLRGCTYPAFFGLLAATGLRVSEAIALDRDDVDLREGLLTVRRSKFGKSRFVPLHDSTSEALHQYGRRRDALCPRPGSPAFFLSQRGIRLKHCSVNYNFAVVSRAVGLRPPRSDHRHGHGPRLHDMRHRLAVKTLLRWYREGRDVEREMPRLSTYLGHVHVADTYWYLEAVPELLQFATERVTGRREDAP